MKGVNGFIHINEYPTRDFNFRKDIDFVQLNEELDLGLSSTPADGRPVIFNLPLGDVIDGTKLYNSVTIYSSIRESNALYNASINLLSKRMVFERKLVEYLERNFLKFICLSKTYFE